MNVSTDGLPPEMQARIQQIIEGAKQKAVANSQPQPQPSAPVTEDAQRAAVVDRMKQMHAAPQQSPVVAPSQQPVKVPNLMDHTIALRQEVGAMRQELHAAAQVIDAVGQAVGQLYATFQSQTVPTDYGPDYQEALQAHQQSQPLNEDY